MRYGDLIFKIAASAVVLAMVVLAVRSPDAVALCTRYFCSISVGVFAVASIVGLATRLRA